MNCGTCRHGFMNPQMKQLLCRRWPPQMTAFTKIYNTVLAGDPTATGTDEQIQSFFNFPVVDPSWACGEWRSR